MSMNDHSFTRFEKMCIICIVNPSKSFKIGCVNYAHFANVIKYVYHTRLCAQKALCLHNTIYCM